MTDQTNTPVDGETPETDAATVTDRIATDFDYQVMLEKARSLERRLRAALSAKGEGGETPGDGLWADIVAALKVAGDPGMPLPIRAELAAKGMEACVRLSRPSPQEPTGLPEGCPERMRFYLREKFLESLSAAPTGGKQHVEVELHPVGTRARLAAAPSLTDEEREAMAWAEGFSACFRADGTNPYNRNIPPDAVLNVRILARALSRVTGKGVEG